MLLLVRMNYKKHSNRSSDDHYAYGLTLKNARVKFSDSDPSRFELIANASKKNSHSWNHYNSDGGSVGTEDLVTGLQQSIESANRRGSKSKLIGSLPAHSKEPQSAYMYEFESIESSANGRKIIIQGKALDHDYVNKKVPYLQSMFGERAVHNHLRFDPTEFFVDNQFGSASNSASPRQTFSGKGRRALARIPYDAVGARPGQRGPLYSFLSSVGHDITHGASTIAHGVSSVATTAASGIKTAADATGSAISSAAKTVASGAEDAAGDVEKGVSQAVKFTDQKIIVPAVNATEELAKKLVGFTHFDFTLKPPALTLDKSSEGGLFYAKASLDPSMNGSLNLKAGIVGALDPATINLNVQPTIAMTGSVGVNLTNAGNSVSETVPGPTFNLPVTDPPVIDGLQVTTEVDFEFDSSVAYADQDLSATVTFTPSALIQLGLSDSKFQNMTSMPTITTTLPSSFEPSAELTFKATPKITFIAGASVPKQVPYVGGKSIAAINTILSNPVVFEYDTSNPKDIMVTTNGDIENDLKLLGVNVPLSNTNLYGPLQTEVTL